MAPNRRFADVAAYCFGFLAATNRISVRLPDMLLCRIMLGAVCFWLLPVGCHPTAWPWCRYIV